MVAVLHEIYTRSSNMKISQCLGVNLKKVQWIQKELDESNGKPYSNHFDKKNKRMQC